MEGLERLLSAGEFVYLMSERGGGWQRSIIGKILNEGKFIYLRTVRPAAKINH